MDWTELTLAISAGDVERASAIAQMVVPYGIYIEDYSDLRTEAPKIAHIDLIDEELLQKDVSKAVIHIYISPEENPVEAISFLRERLDAARIPCELGQGAVKEEEWATAWKKYYHPLEIGQRLLVCPSWEECDAKGRVKLTLDPGMAFGTGTHDTTRLCLELLETAAGPGKQMLDVGSGSGILSIAGALLGCDRVLGVEIDEMAVRVARENSAINHTEDRVTFLCGDLVEKVTGQYPIVCANIVADVIIRLLPDLGPYLAPEGVFIASGIIEEREPDVLVALDRAGFTVSKRRSSGGWVALACRRR